MQPFDCVCDQKHNEQENNFLPEMIEFQTSLHFFLVTALASTKYINKQYVSLSLNSPLSTTFDQIVTFLPSSAPHLYCYRSKT
jgi:hypothetical protein